MTAVKRAAKAQEGKKTFLHVEIDPTLRNQFGAVCKENNVTMRDGVDAALRKVVAQRHAR